MHWQDLIAHITPKDLARLPGDSFEEIWAKLQIEKHEEFVARAALAKKPDLARKLVDQRYETACAMILTKILRQ